MAAKIIGQNHEVVAYELNGRKRFIVDTLPDTRVVEGHAITTHNRALVNQAVSAVGREWSAVYNYIDEWLSSLDGGMTLAEDIPLCNCIESMTY